MKHLHTSILCCIFIAILGNAAVVFAESAPIVGKVKTYPGQTMRYVQVSASLSVTSMKWKITADFGQPITLSLKNKDLIRDEAGNTIKFDSPIDALHFLNARGWELVTAKGGFDNFSAVMQKPVMPK